MSGQVNALECYFFFNTPTSFLPTAASRIISPVIHLPKKGEIERERSKQKTANKNTDKPISELGRTPS